MRCARITFLVVCGKKAPAFTVASLAMIMHGTPSTLPMPANPGESSCSRKRREHERRLPSTLNEKLTNRVLRRQRRFTNQGSTRSSSRNSSKSIARYWNNNKKSIVLGGAKRVTKLIKSKREGRNNGTGGTTRKQC